MQATLPLVWNWYLVTVKNSRTKQVLSTYRVIAAGPHEAIRPVARSWFNENYLGQVYIVAEIDQEAK